LRYLGGKTRIAKWVAENFLPLAKGRTTYVEPFVGSGAAFVQHAPHFETVVASDAHPDLILMWEALARGWQPSPSVTLEEYQQLKASPPSARRGLVGFGASFGGKWFGGFAANTKTRCYLDEACRSVVRNAPIMRGANIWRLDYSEHEIDGSEAIYCDPPYADTTGYSGTAQVFEPARFWAVARGWAQKGALVVVSEERAPGDWHELASCDRHANIRKADNNRRVEKLFVWKGATT